MPNKIEETMLTIDVPEQQLTAAIRRGVAEAPAPHRWPKWPLIPITAATAAVLAGGIYMAAQHPAQERPASVARTKQRQTPTLAQRVAAVKAGAAKKNAAYYGQASKTVQTSSGAIVSKGPDPKSIAELVSLTDATVTGIVTELSARPYHQIPFTVATVLITKVLAGKTVRPGMTIRVQFRGGNLTNPEGDMVTYVPAGSRLPKVGDELAMALGQIPKGANGDSQPFWVGYGPNSIFFKDANGQYRLTPQPKPYGYNPETGKQEPDNSIEERQTKFNQEMNAFIHQHTAN
ncbi:hypothetical protein [Schleiferilactobacillus harbinensis]|jgi:hypothetical protein|uniref:hypothetical protein n=1 Tax=Schleiferilactobacillus harbinensis TaxID=304207 RepID=UPI00242DFE60|nr:hypothetical protein [Schleiferilactobacillus harbinensis]MCI1850987.1 hypothetical protein [Schleiferilactobacillus harbinensis]